MEQKNRKAANKRLLLGKPLTCLGIMLVGYSFTASEKDPVNPKPANVFPAMPPPQDR
jgi:hypothetical protein